MTVEQLTEVLKTLPPKRQVRLARYEDGHTNLYHVNHCCNTEHQDEVCQLWLSQGFLDIE